MDWKGVCSALADLIRLAMGFLKVICVCVGGGGPTMR